MNTSAENKFEPSAAPKIVDERADERFRQKVKELLGGNPDSIWIGGYVEYEWRQSRYALEQYLQQAGGKLALEFGCNVGATSVVLAHLGADVTGVDVDTKYVEISAANAERYGVAEKTRFICEPDTRKLPFPDGHFNLITVNSVFEYVPHRLLPEIFQELDRILSPGGVIFVAGTSNRLSPVEVHSGRWFINYMPRSFGPAEDKVERGVWPWQVLRGFRDYVQLDVADRGEFFFRWKEHSNMSAKKLVILRIINSLTQLLGIPAGLLTPSFSTALRKPLE